LSTVTSPIAVSFAFLIASSIPFRPTTCPRLCPPSITAVAFVSRTIVLWSVGFM